MFALTILSVSNFAKHTKDSKYILLSFRNLEFLGVAYSLKMPRDAVEFTSR